MRLVLGLLIALSAFAQPAASGFLPLDDFVRDWRISKQFTVDVAGKMPADHYGFKATDAEMSFGELMMHIAMSNVFRFAQMSGIKPPPSIVLTAQPKTDKDSALKALNDSFDYVIDVLPKLTPAQLDRTFKVDWKGRPEATGRQMTLNMFVHVAHHRAQAEVYLRLNGIQPPTYTF
jgi:uncharacterized damage-inducible protein DinB